MKILSGQGVSAGIAVGRVMKLDPRIPPVGRIHLSDEQLPAELARLDEAIAATAGQLRRVREVLDRELGHEHSLMIEAHVLILTDDAFSGEIRRRIAADQVNAEWAVRLVAERISDIYARFEDPYLQDKIEDIRDIALRLLKNLSGSEPGTGSAGQDDLIVVSQEITLSLFGDLNLGQLKGLAADRGGWTSHTSILARSLHIPAVIHLKDVSAAVQTGDLMIVDGAAGRVYVNPDGRTLREYRRRLGEPPPDAAGPAGPAAVRPAGGRPPVPDVRLYLNAEFPRDLDGFQDRGVEGVGLFRTEFLFLGRRLEDITREEHQRIYAELSRRVYPAAASIRTFDLGLDQVRDLRHEQPEANPALGLRGIRLSLARVEAFRRQLEGIVRANELGNLRVILPFVSSLDEVRQARELLARIAAEPGAPTARLPLGVMLEIPSTFFLVDALSREVDFFALGTNDLVQYTLAVDRGGAYAPPPFMSAHPAVRQGLELIRARAAANDKEVVCCGEMASHPLFVLLLLGAGFRSFSVNLQRLPLVSSIVRQVERDALDAFYAALQPLLTCREIEVLFLQRLGEFFPAALVDTLLDAQAGRLHG